MNRLTERELRAAKDYEELKWYQGIPVIVAAFGETWKRLADAQDYTDADYFVVVDEDERESFFGTYSDSEPLEPSD
ncbi:MAG TPA: hypothetical protein VEP69_01870 [Thermodesulfovibrionales bacterium]|nr:hypothetical protein [Thermodesulfovibrionales bacterium]